MLKIKKARLAVACVGAALGLSFMPAIARAALPNAEVVGFTYGGSGCPGGSVGYVYDNVNHLMTLNFDKFGATMPAGVSKACNLTFVVKVPSGFQVSVNRVEYLGYADLYPDVYGDLFGWYKYDTNSIIPFNHHFPTGTHGVFDVVDTIPGVSACKSQVTFTTNARVDLHGTRKTSDISELVVDTLQYHTSVVFYIPVAQCP